MAYKMKGPSLYPNYKKGLGVIKVNREDTSTSDGRAKSSPFQISHPDKKTHFPDGTKKSKRDLFNDAETMNEESKASKTGSGADDTEGQDQDKVFDNKGIHIGNWVNGKKVDLKGNPL